MGISGAPKAPWLRAGGPRPFDVALVASGCFSRLLVDTIRYAYPAFFLVFCPDHALFSSRQRLVAFFFLSCTYHLEKVSCDNGDWIDFSSTGVSASFLVDLHAVDLEATTKAGTCIYRNLPLHSCVPPWGRQNGAGFHQWIFFPFCCSLLAVLYVGTSRLQYGAHATTRLLQVVTANFAITGNGGKNGAVVCA